MLDDNEAVRLAVEPLGNAVYRFWPDLIFVVSGFFLPNDIWEVFKQRPHKTVLLCTESPYEDTLQFERMMVWEPDVMLLNDPTNIDAFRANHDNVFYAPHAFDPKLHSPGRATKKYKCDFGFVGTGYKSRLDMLARVDWRGLDVKLAGMWQMAGGTCLEDFVIHPLEECFDNTDAVKLYRSAKISANLYRARTGDGESAHPELNDGFSVGPREIELAATKTFFLRDPRPEGDELFPFLPTFTTAGEMGDLIRFYLQNPKLREQAAQQAFEAVQPRTFEAHAKTLLQRIAE
jgi:spore maturation protein CgeB